MDKAYPVVLPTSFTSLSGDWSASELLSFLSSLHSFPWQSSLSSELLGPVCFLKGATFPSESESEADSLTSTLPLESLSDWLELCSSAGVKVARSIPFSFKEPTKASSSHTQAERQPTPYLRRSYPCPGTWFKVARGTEIRIA